MPRTLEQFVAFSTGSSGLERILRGIEAFSQLILSFPQLLTLLLLPLGSNPKHVSFTMALPFLKGRVGMTRRTIRLFRFLGSFQASWSLYLAEEKTLETWLDIINKTCLGMYGMLESITLPDLLGLNGLRIFEAQTVQDLNRQAQIFWFAALYASILITAMKLFQQMAYRSVPQSGSGYGTGEEPVKLSDGNHQSGNGSSEKLENEAASHSSDQSEKQMSKEAQLEADRLKLKGVVEGRKLERKAWIQNVTRNSKKLGWKLIADLLDMLLPANGVGWISLDPGLIAAAMFCTTLITSMDIWEKCGLEVQKKS